MRYTEGWEDHLDGSYHDAVRRYFMDRARAGGYDVIDMQPVFVDHYRSHEEPFNWLETRIGMLSATDCVRTRLAGPGASPVRCTGDGAMTERTDDATERRDDFAQQLDQAEQVPFLVELWQFMRDNKKWWLGPIVIVLLLLGGLIALSGTVAAPFVYTLF